MSCHCMGMITMAALFCCHEIALESRVCRFKACVNANDSLESRQLMNDPASAGLGQVRNRFGVADASAISSAGSFVRPSVEQGELNANSDNVPEGDRVLEGDRGHDREVLAGDGERLSCRWSGAEDRVVAREAGVSDAIARAVQKPLSLDMSVEVRALLSEHHH
jgi:hypothetical protein